MIPRRRGRPLAALAFSSIAVAMTAAGSAAAAAGPDPGAPVVTVQATITASAAGSPVPAALPEIANTWFTTFFGQPVSAGSPVPAGATAIDIQAPIVAGKATEFTVTCPAGTGLLMPWTVTTQMAGTPIGMIFGRTATRFRFWPSDPAGTVEEVAFCVPRATVTQTTYPAAKRSPVAVPNFLTKGQLVTKGWRIVKLSGTGLVGGQAAYVPVICPAGDTLITWGSVTTGLTEPAGSQGLGRYAGFFVRTAAGSAAASGSFSGYAVCGPITDM